MAAGVVPKDVPRRPALRRGMEPDEFRRWYYLKTELTAFARRLGLATSGSKDVLAARILTALTGEEAPHPASARAYGHRVQIQPPVSRATVIPAGQRCSQVLREFLEHEVGRSFRFDAAMREFIVSGAGKTMGEAVDHWFATRDQGRAPIGPQFELNRFTRQWYAAHPGGTRDDLRAAWLMYRNEPEDVRGKA